MTPFLKKILGMNWLLVLVMYGLLIFGVLMIESAARNVGFGKEKLEWIVKNYGSVGEYFAAMQKRWILVGSLAFFGAAFVDYRWIRWFGIPLYVASLVFMVIAIKQDNAVHNVNLGPISFQPAQLGITSGILLISWLVQDLPKIHRFFGAPFARIAVIGLLAGVPFLMVMKMGDMGSALVWIPVSIVALLMGGVPFRHLTFMGLIGAGMLPLLYFVALPLISKRGPERIDTWLRMLRGQEVNITKEAYAPYYVSMEVGKAGWKGTGWKATEEQGSLLAKGFIPKETAHNDYIFGVIAEEIGFRGCLILFLAFTILIIQALIVAFYSRDHMGRLYVCMVVALFFAHTFESIGMCIQFMPITGIPLPLISYSGTFVLVCMLLLGIVQSVWIHRHSDMEMIEED